MDRREKEQKEAEKKKKASNTQKMKECFEHINKSPSSNKINRQELLAYFKLLATKITDCEMTKTCSDVHEECLDEVWHQFDSQGTGQVSYHQLRPMMESIVVCEAAMAEEMRLFQEKQARRKQEYNDKVAARDARIRELEEQRAQAEMEGAMSQEIGSPVPE